MRKRTQNGVIYRDKGTWYVRYFEDRVENGQVRHKRIAKQLGAVATGHRGKRPPKEIEDLAKAIVGNVTTSSVKPEQVLNVGDFVTQVYLPHVTEYLKPSTAHGYRDIWENHIGPLAASDQLKDIRTCDIQGWLNLIAKSGLSRNSLHNIKTFVSGVFNVAKRLSYFDGTNPAQGTATSPKAAQQAETYAYDLDEITSILSYLPEPARTIFAVASFTGLRHGEIQGLLWENYDGQDLNVTRSIWNGRVGAPKTYHSRAGVPVIRQLRMLLDAHGNTRTGPMFPTGKGTPLSLSNVMHRQILPALNRCEVCQTPEVDHDSIDHDYKRDQSRPEWHGWHACRRGLATNLHELGVPDKEIQAVLRHANVSVTQKCYVKTRNKGVQEAMQKLEDLLNVSYLSANEWNGEASKSVN